MSFRNKLISSLLKHKDRNAFCIQGMFYTYADLKGIVVAIQAELEKEHNNADRIGILIHDSLETYAAIVAILLLGKTYIPIHPGHPADRVAHIVRQSNLQLLFSPLHEAEYAGVRNLNTTELNGTDSPLVMKVEGTENKAAYILFTSGSTGVPKGTPITYHNLNSFLTAFNNLGYELTEADRFLQMFDLTFDLSVVSYLVPLCIGACVYTIPDKGMKFTNVYSVLEEYNITFALMVPSILTFLRQYFDEIHLPDMRYSLFCGEALHKDLVLEWRNCVPNAVIENVYGPTEATIFCLTYRIDTNREIAESNGIVCIGKPMSGMEAIVADENNQPLPDGEKGELCLHGHQVTPGYLDDEKNQVAFFMLEGKRYYRTGDIARRDVGGDFVYCGRADHQVKIQGFRVELSEIEYHARMAYNCNVVAIVINTPKGLSQIELVMECLTVNNEDVVAQLKTKLPGYMVPANVHFIAPFPLNVNGKTDRKELEKIINPAT